MRETFYILQEVQQRGLTLSLEMIGFVRKRGGSWGGVGGPGPPSLFFAPLPPPPPPIIYGSKTGKYGY